MVVRARRVQPVGVVKRVVREQRLGRGVGGEHLLAAVDTDGALADHLAEPAARLLRRLARVHRLGKPRHQRLLRALLGEPAGAERVLDAPEGAREARDELAQAVAAALEVVEHVE